MKMINAFKKMMKPLSNAVTKLMGMGSQRSQTRHKRLCVTDEAWRPFTEPKHQNVFLPSASNIMDFRASAEAEAILSCADTKIIMHQSSKAFSHSSKDQQTATKGFKRSTREDDA